MHSFNEQQLLNTWLVKVVLLEFHPRLTRAKHIGQHRVASAHGLKIVNCGVPKIDPTFRVIPMHNIHLRLLICR